MHHEGLRGTTKPSLRVLWIPDRCPLISPDGGRPDGLQPAFSVFRPLPPHMFCFGRSRGANRGRLYGPRAYATRFLFFPPHGFTYLHDPVSGTEVILAAMLVRDMIEFIFLPFFPLPCIYTAPFCLANLNP